MFALTSFIICGYIFKESKLVGSLTKEFISTQMWINMLGQAIYQSVAIILILATYLGFTSDEARSLLLNVIAFMTLFNAFNSKKCNGERNVFIDTKCLNSFTFTWIICSILQVFLNTENCPLSNKTLLYN